MTQNYIAIKAFQEYLYFPVASFKDVTVHMEGNMQVINFKLASEVL